VNNVLKMDAAQRVAEAQLAKTREELDRLYAGIARLHNQRDRLEVEERELYCRANGLVKGETILVKMVRGEVYRGSCGAFAGIYKMRMGHQPWVYIHPLKKDGKPGKRLERLYEWTVDRVNEL
jgi:hypothetical protein